MINNILRNSCYELKRRMAVATKKLKGRHVLSEAEGCYQWVRKKLQVIDTEVQRIERILNKNLQDAVLQQALYSDLSKHSNDLSFIDQFFLNALFRLKVEDRLVLQLIHWLHTSHPHTNDKPFIVSNGAFSVAVAISPDTPSIYFLPVTSEASFLHLPLVFHEFGHRLFQLHREEMEDLIEELQSYLNEYFQLMVNQDDEKFKSYEQKATEIIEAWREWMEEFFCDAVGLTIGGPSYLKAFSQFTRMGGMKEFFMPERSLARRSHPVTLLRIRFLVARAKRLGWTAEAQAIEKEWRNMAEMLKAKNDYFGYFEPPFEEKATAVLDDMLEEAGPIPYDKALLAPESYVSIIDQAWEIFQKNPVSFEDWEHKQIVQILKSAPVQE